MPLRGVNRVKKIIYTVRRRFKPGAVILMYHRVANLPRDPFQLAVAPDRFAQHLEYISRAFQPMHLTNLVQALEKGPLPERAIAITFDDGYVDNYLYAYPMLKSARIPATIFTTGHMVDNRREFWWDDLERLLTLPERLPARLKLRIADREHEWPTESPDQRQTTCNSLQQLIKPLNVEGRDRVVHQLAQWAGLDQAGRPDYRAVTTAQLIELANSALIDIGGHTLSHPQLSNLSADIQHAEIVGGRQRLESIIGKKIETFAYPYGTPTDFTDETVAIVRAAGFQAACTTVHGSVEPGDDLFRLRRWAVYNWDATIFKQKLNSFFVLRD